MTKEFAVLETLMRRPLVVVSRSELTESCWDQLNDPSSNVVDVVVAQLRRRLGQPDPIRTVRGVGYSIDTPGPPWPHQSGDLPGSNRARLLPN